MAGMSIPDQPAGARRNEQPVGIEVRCDCGARISAPPRAVGHRAQCPRCGGLLLLVRLDPRAPGTPLPAADHVSIADLDNLLVEPDKSDTVLLGLPAQDPADQSETPPRRRGFTRRIR